ncbi:MAG: glycosyltransferase [Chitinophagaceae bacterium]|nr:glycosyltransferase [Chitinophagaceae bacterium]
MKKVLIITYYWPPSGGAGVQRWLKMSKYLPEFGWEPIIYTALNPEYPIIDRSLEKDIPAGLKVIRQPIWEPYSWYKRFTGQKQEENLYSGFLTEGKPKSFTQKLSIWVRGNFFIPDARCFWIKPSIKFLVAELRKNPVDYIISTGTPHSTHLIAMGVKEKLNIPWLADFRDPWTNIDFYHQLMLSRWADAKHHRLEKEVLTKADKVTTVSWHWAEELGKIGNRKVEVITNGFDEEDYAGAKVEVDKKFSISHIGLLSADRTLTGFWSVLHDLCLEVPSFKEDLVIRLAGKVDYEVFREIEQFGLTPHLEFKNYVSHDEAIRLQQKSAILLLVLNNVPNVLGHIPGKLFEYLAAGRPILGIGNIDGDAARIVRETGRGVFCGFDEMLELKKKIFHLNKSVMNAKIDVKSNVEVKYSRKKLAAKVADLLIL